MQVQLERYLELAPLSRVASGLGLATSGVIAIHQRSIYQAGTGFPVLGQSALLLARCGLCTVLKAGTEKKRCRKGLHVATKALSKAQKVLRENNEAKQHHKAQWAKHVGEAIQTWQTQLREFRKQQTSFQEVSEKAKHDIDHARYPRAECQSSQHGLDSLTLRAVA